MQKEFKRRTLNALRLAQIMQDSSANGDRFCFVLGAGASRESGIKTGVEMAREWGRYIQEHEIDFGMEAIANLKDEISLDDLTQADSRHYFGIYEFRWRGEPQNGYHYIQKQIEGKSPSYGYYPLAMMLAQTKHNLVITTNFDNLVEDALYVTADQRPFVVGHESLTPYIDLNQDRPIIAKLHRGLFLKPFSSKAETDALRKEWEGALTRAFGLYIPVVIGYAGGDHSLMDYLQDSSTSLRGCYWCFRAGEEPSDEIKQMVVEKGGFFVEIGGFDSVLCAIGNHFGYKSPAIDIYERMTTRAKKMTKDYEERYRKLMEELQAKPKASPEAATVMSMLTREQAERIAVLNERIKDDPEDHDAYYQRGDIYRRVKECEKAMADHTNAIKLLPDSATYWFSRAVDHRIVGNHADAIADITRAIELFSVSSLFYAARGDSFREEGKYAKALSDLDTAIKLDSHWPQYYGFRAEILDALGETDKAQQDRAKAEELLANE